MIAPHDRHPGVGLGGVGFSFVCLQSEGEGEKGQLFSFLFPCATTTTTTTIIILLNEE